MKLLAEAPFFFQDLGILKEELQMELYLVIYKETRNMKAELKTFAVVISDGSSV